MFQVFTILSIKKDLCCNDFLMQDCRVCLENDYLRRVIVRVVQNIWVSAQVPIFYGTNGRGIFFRRGWGMLLRLKSSYGAVRTSEDEAMQVSGTR